MVLFQGSGAISLLNSIMDNFSVAGAWELSYFITIIYGTFFMTIPIVTYIEKLLVESRGQLEEIEKEFQVLFNNSTSGIAKFSVFRRRSLPAELGWT